MKNRFQYQSRQRLVENRPSQQHQHKRVSPIKYNKALISSRQKEKTSTSTSTYKPKYLFNTNSNNFRNSSSNFIGNGSKSVRNYQRQQQTCTDVNNQNNFNTLNCGQSYQNHSKFKEIYQEKSQLQNWHQNYQQNNQVQFQNQSEQQQSDNQSMIPFKSCNITRNQKEQKNISNHQNNNQSEEQNQNFYEKIPIKTEQILTSRSSKSKSKSRQRLYPMDIMMKLQSQFSEQENRIKSHNQYQEQVIKMKNIQLKKQKVKQNSQKIDSCRSKLQQIYQNYKKKEQIISQVEINLKKRQLQFLVIYKNNEQLQSEIQKLNQMIKKALLQREKQKVIGGSISVNKLKTFKNAKSSLNTNRSQKEIQQYNTTERK